MFHRVKLQGLPDSFWAPFTGVISCAELVVEAVWAFRNTNHIYPSQEELEIAPAFGGIKTKIKIEGRRRKSLRIYPEDGVI